MSRYPERKKFRIKIYPDTSGRELKNSSSSHLTDSLMNVISCDDEKKMTKED